MDEIKNENVAGATNQNEAPKVEVETENKTSSKKFLIVALLFVVVAVAFVSFNQQSKTSEVLDTQNQIQENVLQEETPAPTDVVTDIGMYAPYDQAFLQKAENGEVVLFFRASWCPTCKVLNENIVSNLNNIPNGVVILDVDYDNSQELKEKYGVTVQHTLVQVDKDGNMLKKWSGSATLEDMVSQIEFN